MYSQIHIHSVRRSTVRRVIRAPRRCTWLRAPAHRAPVAIRAPVIRAPRRCTWLRAPVHRAPVMRAPGSAPVIRAPGNQRRSSASSSNRSRSRSRCRNSCTSGNTSSTVVLIVVVATLPLAASCHIGRTLVQTPHVYVYMSPSV